MHQGKIFFFDDEDIAERRGVERVLHAADVHPDNPVVWGNRPWEHYYGTWIYGTVMRDQKTGEFRMWYQTNAGQPEGALVCYALSSDGIHWEKPELGLIEFRGTRDNNIVWATGYPDAYCPSVIFDPLDPDPARRYKLYTWDVRSSKANRWPGFLASWEHDAGTGGAGMWLAISPDGIHFVPYGHAPLLENIGDVLPTIFDEQRNRFISFTKINELRAGDPLYRRAVGMSISQDGIHWSNPALILTPDEEDDARAQAMGGKRTEFYGLSGFPYEGIYIGFLWVFYIMNFAIRPDKGRGWDDGPLGIQLVYSRDGEMWKRTFSREEVIPRRPQGNFDYVIGAVVNRPIIVNDEIWVYYSGCNATHGMDPPKAYFGIGLAKFRKDGFVSLGCGPREGMVLTKPITISGNALELNLDARRGYVKIALCDPDGTPISGFTLDECDLVTSNNTSQQVTWHGESDLSKLYGKQVSVRIVLWHSNLYSLRFANRDASNQ